MLFASARDDTGERARAALDLVTFDQPARVRLHWTNKPYVWQVNDGEEVFAVFDGEVYMHYRVDGVEKAQLSASVTSAGAGLGDEHVAHPRGEARILVVERTGSI